MTQKRILCPQRLRRVPHQFSWVDHRLVRDKYICGLNCESLALYLFLVTVADAQGLSYYSDGAIHRYLQLDTEQQSRARSQLCRAGLIVYSSPLYQVLSLEQPSSRLPVTSRELFSTRTASEPVSIGHLLDRVMGGGK